LHGSLAGYRRLRTGSLRIVYRVNIGYDWGNCCCRWDEKRIRGVFESREANDLKTGWKETIKEKQVLSAEDWVKRICLRIDM